MTTAISSSICPTHNDNGKPHRRAHSKDKSFLRIITRDICIGFRHHSTEKSQSKHDIQSTYKHKPRHAGRDALKTTTPRDQQINEPDLRDRQDSFAPDKPSHGVKLSDVGLVPDRSLDSWSQGWDIAYERRVNILHSKEPKMSSAVTISPAEARDITFACVPRRVRTRSGGHWVSPAPAKRGIEVEEEVVTTVEDVEGDSEGEHGAVEKKRWGRVYGPDKAVVAKA